MKDKRNYLVYFQIGDKKLKKRIIAESEDQAKEEVIKSIIFHKAELDKSDYFNKSMDVMDDIMDILNIKK